MPLAQLARRARNAKTGTAMLQNAAHYLGEAAAALAASYWLERVQAQERESSPAMQLQLRTIVSRGASFGAWVGLWREAAAVAGGLAALSSKLTEAQPLDRLQQALEAEADEIGDDGTDLARALRRGRKRGVLGFFEFLASFRNKIYGHGVMLAEAVCRRLARPFVDAVCHVIRQPAVFDGDWLGRSALDVLRPDEPRYWLRLSGVNERRPGDDKRWPSADKRQEGGLCFVGEGRVTALSFWVVQDEDATGLSRFGFFQRAPAKRGKGPLRIKGVEYLDYLSGRFRHDAHRDALQSAASRWMSADGTADGAAAADEHGDASLHARSADERRFGDFIIEAELGRGAMGIVYRARQLSLGRRVALKVLPPAMLTDPIALGRFHREVQALARCDHPNVVRVLTSGVEQSRPWFAMELVEGADLSEVFATLAAWKGKADLKAGHLSAASSSLRDRRRRRDSAAPSKAKSEDDAAALPEVPVEHPEPPALDQLDDGRQLYQRLAELFSEAAQGVEEIHSRGVLHRDIKPANLMLSGDGQRLVVMDLGLAKVSDASVSYTTASGGDFVGSARYAAPEQLQAKLLKVDHRADVYSLAATLYELATLTTLYPANEIPALLQQKLNEDPVPARSIERSVPRDLETILQKALARRPEDRYRSAAELSEDLQAFAQARPIRARPPSAFEYLRLFYVRQKRMVAVGAAAVTMLVVVVIAGFWLVNQQRSQAIKERDRASRERDRASRERDRAESLAMFIADDVYARLAPIGKLDLLDDVNDRMVEHYKSRDRAEPEAAYRYAEAVLRAAEVRHLQGKVEQARQGYLQAQQLLQKLDAAAEPSAKVRAALAQTYHQLAGAHFNQNDLAAAHDAADRALALRSALVKQEPEERAHRRQLARSERLMGVVRERQGQRAEALACYRRAVAIGRALTEGEPDDREARMELGRNLINVGDSLEAMGKLPEALAEYRAALTTLTALSVREPSNVKVKRQMATSHDSVARIHRKQGQAELAMTSYQQALELRAQLVRFDASRAGWQRDLAASHGHVAFIAQQRDDLDAAKTSYEKSLSLSQALVKRDATNVRWQMDVAITQANLAAVLSRRGDLAEARALYQASLDTRRGVVERDPSNAEYRHELALVYGLVAGVMAQQGEWKRAEEHARLGIAQYERITDGDPQNATWRRGLVDALRQQAKFLDKRGDRSAAKQQRERAIKLVETLEGAGGVTVAALKAEIRESKRQLAKPPAIVQEPIVSRSRKGDAYE